VPTTERLVAGAGRLLQVDLTDPELYRNGFPHELFVGLRGHGAVLRHPEARVPNAPDGIEFWAVIGHPEVQRVNRDWETFSAVDGPSVGPTRPARRGHTLVASDPPSHTRLRRLVSTGFTPRMIARLDDLVVRRTREVLDAAAARGECDFVRDVAYQVPMHLIADIVGIPESDRPWVFAATDTMMRAADPQSGLTPDDRARAERELFEYARRLGADKRDRPDDDVWSLLAVAEIDDDGGGRSRLSELELDMFFLILSIAGSETTRNAISQGLVALLEHPDQLAALRADRSLLDTATDEVIRWASPVTSFGRTATTDVELDGCAVRAGDRLTMWFPSANRDERAFADPFRFDVTRSPNHHVSFGGGGVHYCLGAHLARREVRTVLDQLLTRFATLEVTGPLAWAAAGPDQTVGTSLDRLPVRLGEGA
jgi:cytochrome P450